MVSLFLALAVLPSQADDARRQVSVFIKNHAKNHPKEEIVVKREKDKLLLIARIYDEDDNDKSIEKKAAISREEWNLIWKLVRDEKLLDWEPIRGTFRTDYPSLGFSVYERRVVRNRWSSPMKNEEGPRKLRVLLSQLAAKKKVIKGLPLKNLVPPKRK